VITKAAGGASRGSSLVAFLPLHGLEPAGELATAIARLSLARSISDIHRALEGTRLETLQRLVRAAEYRDDATSEHTERVARTTELLARTIGRPEAEVSRLRLAAPLHDIGKLAVSDALLLKPGALTPDEQTQMRRHAAAGAAILAGSTSDVLRMAGEIALTHHEWWDGSGYPAGLKGEAIPLSGRIVAIADVFDALAHARPYKPAWPVDAAVAEIDRLRGRQFDPLVVAAFHSLDPQSLVQPIECRV